MESCNLQKQVKVSVITPAFNAAPYLVETVKSVQTQSLRDWELFIIDDCSCDGTYELACGLAKEDGRIFVLRNEKNLGVAAARNKALDIAHGEYIAFLDADDLWLPEKLQKQVDFMEAGEYILTYTNFKKFDSETGKHFPKIFRSPKTMTVEQIYGDTSIGCLTVMVNRKMAGPFHMPLLDHTEDNITWQDILARGNYKAYRLDEVLSLYRVHPDSLTHGKVKAAMKQWNTYRTYYKFSVLKSMYYFSIYAYHAIKKHFL